MNPQNSNDEELKRREQELREREHALRLRELEAEINQPAISPTTKHQLAESSLQQRYRQVLNAVKFLGIVVAVVIAIRIATWLATAVMVGGIAWVVYKVFLERDRKKP